MSTITHNTKIQEYSIGPISSLYKKFILISKRINYHDNLSHF